MKILLDSSIYIRGWHDPRFFERYVSLTAPFRPLTYASSVVIGECRAGARDRAGRKLVQTVFKPFEGANRIVTPTRRDWLEAGRLLADMIKTDRALRIDRTAEKGDRSRFIDRAVRHFVRSTRRSALRQLLREGAVKRADRDRLIAEEWFNFDEESWGKRRK